MSGGPMPWPRSILKALAVTAFFLILSISSSRYANAAQVSLSTCRLVGINSAYVGLCGPLLIAFDHVPTISLANASTLTTGKWRDDLSTVTMLAGTMRDPTHPDSGEPIDFEVYPGGLGVLQSDEGWFPATGIHMSNGNLQFDLFTAFQVAPTSVDQRIVRRAAMLLANTSAWNRSDDRNCPTGAETLSIYCAMEKATVQVTGGFSHTRPALQVVRNVIAERSAGRHYDHLLMDYNNDVRTRLDDVQSAFKEAEQRMGDQGWLASYGFVQLSGNRFEPG